MLVTVEWDDDTKQIMVIRYRKGWTWADHTRARVDIDAMSASVPHMVDVIADVVGANQLPPGAALNQMTAALHADFSVHVVEVCRTCRWNHLVLSYVLGTGGDPDTGRTRDRRRTVAE